MSRSREDGGTTPEPFARCVWTAGVSPASPGAEGVGQSPRTSAGLPESTECAVTIFRFILIHLDMRPWRMTIGGRGATISLRL
jgi:hypothetical protein